MPLNEKIRQEKILSYKDYMKERFEKKKKVQSEKSSLRPIFKVMGTELTSMEEVGVKFVKAEKNRT